MAVSWNIKVLDAFPADYAGEFVVRFGHIPVPDAIDPRLLHDIPRPSPDSAQSITATPLDLLRGVTFLVDPGCPDMDMDAVTDVQMEYLYRYYKEIVLPGNSPLAPAAQGVRGQQAPEIVRILNKLRNMPYLLRYPLTRRLAAQDVRLPVLALLPGPSLARIAPHLPELARSHVVVAVSRTIRFCLEHGVTPDFVVQLDTYLIQRGFYDDLPPLPDTTLVALSISPVYGLADRFRGVLFMDSFDLAILKNPYRMRENGLSTLMACMGLAECISAPYALLVGANLSFPIDHPSWHYFNSSGEGTARPAPAPPCIQVSGDRLVLRNRASRRVYTTLIFLAVAREAERFALDIGRTTGVRFYVDSDDGILPAAIATLRPEELLQAPAVDKTALAEKIDRALSRSETVELMRLKMDCAKAVQALDQNILFLDSCRVRKAYDEVADNPIALFAQQERDFNLPADPEVRLGFSVRIARKWRQAAAQVRNLAQAHMIVRRRGAVPLVCLPREASGPFADLERLFPGFVWDVRPVVSPTDRQWPVFPRPVFYLALHKILASLQVAFVTAAAREVYGYHFEVYGGDNLYYLAPLPQE